MRRSKSSFKEEVLVIVAAGELGDKARLIRRLAGLRARLRVIAADGGYLHCLALGLEPEMLVGDLDSLPVRYHSSMRERVAQVYQHPTDKNESDLALALEQVTFLLSSGGCRARKLVFLGVTGGREDHHHASLLELSEFARRSELQILVFGHQSDWYYTQARQTGVEVGLDVGQVVSIFAASQTVRGLKTQGLKWDGSQVRLLRPGARGLSNIATSTRVRVEVEKGCVWVVVPHGPFRKRPRLLGKRKKLP